MTNRRFKVKLNIPQQTVLSWYEEFNTELINKGMFPIGIEVLIFGNIYCTKYGDILLNHDGSVFVKKNSPLAREEKIKRILFWK